MRSLTPVILTENRRSRVQPFADETRLPLVHLDLRGGLLRTPSRSL
jgi:hypothetical protein